MKLNRGSVVLCRVPMPSEELRESKVRPGLIVSKDFNNERLDDVIIAICTSNISRSYEAGIRIPSVVRCESLLTINKSMIIKVLGKLSDKGIREVDACLKDALGLE